MEPRKPHGSKNASRLSTMTMLTVESSIAGGMDEEEVGGGECEVQLALHPPSSTIDDPPPRSIRNYNDDFRPDSIEVIGNNNNNNDFLSPQDRFDDDDVESCLSGEGGGGVMTKSAASTQEQDQQRNNQKWDTINRRLRFSILLLLVAIILFVVIDSLTAQRIRWCLMNFLHWIKDNKVPGMFAYTGVYFLCTALFIPGSLLTLGGGFIFSCAFGLAQGVVLGTIAIFFGASAGAIWAFVLGRYLLRDCVEQMTKKYPKLDALDRALDEKGLRIMILLRLSPIMPFNVINYAAGITSLSLTNYALALFALIPGIVLLSFLGASAGAITEMNNTEMSPLQIVVIAIGATFGIIGIALTTFYAKKELRKACERRNSALTDSRGDESSSNDYDIRSDHDRDVSVSTVSSSTLAVPSVEDHEQPSPSRQQGGQQQIQMRSVAA